MEKYKYGPLVYNTIKDDTQEGNFYWSGLAPVGYDELGIPIDPKGNQCLPVECPLHPHYKPKKFTVNQTLNESIPTIEDFREWFDDHFLNVSDYQLKKYILRWYSFLPEKFKGIVYRNLLAEHLSVNEMIDRIWPDEQIS